MRCDPAATGRGLLARLAGALDLVLDLGRDVEDRLAAADAAVALAAEALLLDLHVHRNVELAPGRLQVVDVFPRRHAVNGGAEAGAEEGVVEVFADDGVLP